MNILDHKLGQAMLHVTEQGKRPCFRIKGLRITVASAVSVNPGALYIKDDSWNYIGKVTSEGFMKIRHPSKITSEQKLLILEAIHKPESVAMANGKETGICCCCGRTLTNKLSIELGIGPICRDLWFPNSIIKALEPIPKEAGELLAELEPIEHTTVREMLEDLEARDSLELDLGAPYEPKASVAIVSEPTVTELVTIYKSLDARQKDVFLSLIENSEDNQGDNNDRD